MVVRLRPAEGRVEWMQVEPLPSAGVRAQMEMGDWVFETYPDVFNQMFRDFSDPQLTAELMRTYYPEWIASLG